MDDETKIKMDLLRERLGNSFLSLLSQTKAGLMKKTAYPNDVTVKQAIDDLYERVEKYGRG